MDSLIAKADTIAPLGNKRKVSARPPNKKKPAPPPSDRTLQSISQHTALPKSLRPTAPLPDNVPSHSHIQNKKLRAELNRHSAQAARSKALLEDAEMMLADDAGKIEVEGEMERTWRVGQTDIVREAGQEAARGRREWKLDGGPYRSRYTRNGRCVAPLLEQPPGEMTAWSSLTRHVDSEHTRTAFGRRARMRMGSIWLSHLNRSPPSSTNIHSPLDISLLLAAQAMPPHLTGKQGTYTLNSNSKKHVATSRKNLLHLSPHHPNITFPLTDSYMTTPTLLSHRKNTSSSTTTTASSYIASSHT